MRQTTHSELPPGPLDHDAVAERGMIELYFRGDLAPEEEERFEAHLVECAACQEELEAQASFLRGIKTVAAEEAVRSAVRLGLLARWSRRAAAILGVFVALLAAGYLGRENLRLAGRLDDLVVAGTTAPGELSGPLAGVPVVLLGVVRSEAVPATAVVADPGSPFSLAVDVGADPRFTGYDVTVLDAAGESHFVRRGLLPNDLEVILLTFPGGFLPPGEYRLVTRGILRDGESAELASHPFTVAADR